MEKPIERVLLACCTALNMDRKVIGTANWHGRCAWLACTPTCKQLFEADESNAIEGLVHNQELPPAGGLWVWEGEIIDFDDDDDAEEFGAKGTFRAPTMAELGALLCIQQQHPYPAGSAAEYAFLVEELCELHDIDEDVRWILRGAL